MQKIHQLIKRRSKGHEQNEKGKSEKGKEEEVRPQPKVINNQTFGQFRKELKFVQFKILALQTKKICQKQRQWGDLHGDIGDVLQILQLKKLKNVFQKKYSQQIRLLNDFYTKIYRRSIFRCCFVCCPEGILRQLKYYKFIDDIFQLSISDVQNTQRNIYFYVNLLYTKLFVMLVMVADRLEQQFNKKMVQAIEVHSKHKKVIDRRKKEVGQLQQIEDVFVFQHQNFKGLKQSQRYHSSYVLQSDDPNLRKTKVQPRQPLDTALLHQNYYDQFVQLQQQIQKIILDDWNRVIQTQEWSSQSYYGFIQINEGMPIQTSLQFKDCKLKTNYLFSQIASSSFDLRTYLVRKSKKIQKSHQFILDSLYQDSTTFKLRFWLDQAERTPQNYQKIQKFLLLTMRIGVKQKISRMSNLKYKQKTKNWMIKNYVHLNLKEKNIKYTNFQNHPSGIQKSHEQLFWWVNLGQNLIRAIIQVTHDKIKKTGKQNFIKPSFRKIKSKIQLPQSNNPQTNQRLIKMDSKTNRYPAYQI